MVSFMYPPGINPRWLARTVWEAIWERGLLMAREMSLLSELERVIGLVVSGLRIIWEEVSSRSRKVALLEQDGVKSAQGVDNGCAPFA
eukprot:3848739-Pyramimonas_sp.AAC.1